MLQKLVKSVSHDSGHSSRGGGALSVIAPDVHIIGDIRTDGEMQIDGQVQGDITCKTLVVGEGARITGAVIAETVKVHGELKGKIDATAISIARSARVVGEINHLTLEVEAGAHFEGHCIRKPEPAAEPKRLAVKALTTEKLPATPEPVPAEA